VTPNFARTGALRIRLATHTNQGGTLETRPSPEASSFRNTVSHLVGSRVIAVEREVQVAAVGSDDEVLSLNLLLMSVVTSRSLPGDMEVCGRLDENFVE
jgi:hypothetical protein